MEAILLQFDTQKAELRNDAANNNRRPSYDPRDVARALEGLAVALRSALPLLEGRQRRRASRHEKRRGDDDGSDTIDARWLLRTLRPVPSDLGTAQIARLVVEASTLGDSQQQEEALFSALGASEEAMAALFQIFPHMGEIRHNVTLRDLGVHEDGGGATTSATRTTTTVDPAEAERQRLRNEAWNAAQVAAIAQAEVDAAMGPSGGAGATHTITRSSEMQLQKAARKAQKRAAQTLERAKAAGAILDGSDLMAMQDAASGAMMGQGGLVGRSHDELLALQASLMPEGSRKHYNDQGLPTGTERFDDEVIGYERVTIPPPHLDPSRLHARLQIEDILDPECARAFAGTTSLNPMQSTVFDTAFHRRENMLVCAPTGAGEYTMDFYPPLRQRWYL